MSPGPVIVSVAAVALGALLGLVRGPTGAWLGPIRTFGLVSVLGLILVLLLPEALSGLGLAALLLIGVGYAVPTALDRFGERIAGRDHKLGAELGFWVVLFHQFLDGIALASESAVFHSDDHWDALIAMSVHTVPLTTLVVVTFNHWRGPTHALTRAAAIALATVAGVAIVGAVPVGAFATLHPWLAALVSGMLLHIIASGPFPPLEDRRRRAMDAVASVAGVALVAIGMVGAHSHSESGAQFSQTLLDAFFAMSLATAPALLFGLVAGAAIGAFGAPVPNRWLSSARATLDATRGAVIGAPLPVCSCGVLPVSQGLRRRGASTAFVLAFLVATPEIGVDAFALSTQFLGWELSFVRLGSALLLAVAAGVVGAKLATRTPTTPPTPPAASGDAEAGCCGPEHEHHGHDHDHDHGVAASAFSRFASELDELVFHIGPWTLLGLVIAAYAEAVLPVGSFAASAAGADIFIITFVAIPSYVCASSMTPLAAVLLVKGFSPGAVLAGLLLGPATNVATFAFVRSELGRRGVVIWTAAMVLFTWAMAVAVNAAVAAGLLDATPVHTTAHEHGSAWYAWAAVAIIAILMGRGIWRVGFGRWLASLGDFMGLLARRSPA